MPLSGICGSTYSSSAPLKDTDDAEPNTKAKPKTNNPDDASSTFS